ncbi:MAG: endonuclease III [Acidobacteria bacterium]|nr:endonuclease III [Acidobacteriota bacterium]
MNQSERTKQIIQILGKKYPDPTCALHHHNPLQLLVATILSAQCTDERVNQVTPRLFVRFPTAGALAEAELPELEELIRSTGFFRNKAKNIRDCCRMIVTEFGGRVPDSIADLLRLPGVARKTANVVLGDAYGVAAGVVVDTHVRRLSNRLGLTIANQPDKIERDLMRLVPPMYWIPFAHWLIFHGRETCKARKPFCDRCELLEICPRIGVS